MHRLLSGLALLLTLTLVPALASSAAPDAPSVGPTADRSGGLVIRPRAWGPLRLRMTAAEAQDTGMVSEQVSHCAAGYDMEPRFADRGFVLWREPGGDFSKLQVGGFVILGTVDRTENGAGVGTTLRRLRQLYPRLTKLTNYSELEDQHPSKRNMWTVGVRKNGAFRNFQFPYGPKPGPRTKVEMVVVTPKQSVYMGC